MPEIPLGEDTEAYRVTVTQGGQVLRDEEVSTSNWVYTAAMQGQDGLSGFAEVLVAQLSPRFGAGLAARVLIAL